ncbi:hypothetical protein, variant [Aphanomyces invadans]|uniref:Uncharacterized protein n=1 Tax=Aphanomyces invadans TaxID=157072 RepID=A0A024UDI6_9STRA|nr:hypothetical protein H310_04340 [Aphanomyces invadans]XP_008866878.1 hypothetical protein, variant [Aphanomyces invadans]ETW03921.1 hypothetical protein H310_04340 [Aphanomyces invadans]ETW03922.1 hypothetical protein, variant [Aphanomyces invadans]|eukprot:XP_008866877.1 hypothetical protein H310_04340 [Aphanomyces invadans]
MDNALVEASSGSLGALFACLALFPLDVAKTKRQADTHTTKKGESTLALLRSIWVDEGVNGLFSGLGPKAAHTVLSNFFYFYWYAWLKAAYEKSRGPLTTSATLAIGAAAGAINMTITLPLDVISTRIQTAAKAQSSPSSLTLLRSMYHEHGILSLWKGYLPSLVLVSNPSIFYTIFDRLKVYVARDLSAIEAFVLAALAKSIATIVTYPVIRAKVLMQAAENANEHASLSMVQVLDRTWKNGGAAALFQGCHAQLVNTVVKSAVVVMTKEQIAAWTVRLLYPFQQKA